MIFREITTDDIPALFEVRTQTDENNFTREELLSLGIDYDSVRERLTTTCKGWLCETEGKVTGFAMGDRETGELWVIAVLPEYIKRGIGGRLLSLVEKWLFSKGCVRLWLTTDIDVELRAYSFYLHNGWHDDKIEDGLRYMYKER
jgi:GNAT superfamily N-acetyltransferase